MDGHFVGNLRMCADKFWGNNGVFEKSKAIDQLPVLRRNLASRAPHVRHRIISLFTPATLSQFILPPPDYR